jgi:hypothetical protein
MARSLSAVASATVRKPQATSSLGNLFDYSGRRSPFSGPVERLSPDVRPEFPECIRAGNGAGRRGCAQGVLTPCGPRIPRAGNRRSAVGAHKTGYCQPASSPGRPREQSLEKDISDPRPAPCPHSSGSSSHCSIPAVAAFVPIEPRPIVFRKKMLTRGCRVISPGGV